MPTRSRRRRAAELSLKWHGKSVTHVARGKQRWGRMSFRGPQAEKWSRIHWSDGTTSDHNGAILPHLLVVDDAAVPVQLPAAAPAPRVLTLRPADLPCVHADPQLEEIVQHLKHTMSSVPCTAEWANELRHAINDLHDGPPDNRYTFAVSLVRIELQKALMRLLPIGQFDTCLLPVASAVPAWVQRRATVCFANYPGGPTWGAKAPGRQRHAVRQRTGQQSAHHTLFDPFGLELHQFYAAGDGIDYYHLECDHRLLDLMLPACRAHATKVVVALVPSTYVRTAEAHRHMWLSNLQRERCALYVHVIHEDGTVNMCGWLLLFPSCSMRHQLLPAALPDDCTECLWKASRPTELQCTASYAWKL